MTPFILRQEWKYMPTGTLSQYAIREAYKKTKIFIPYGARCCVNHFTNNVINEEAIKMLKPFAEMYSLNNGLAEDATNTDLLYQFRQLSFLSERICYQNTGYSLFEFRSIYECLMNDDSNMRDSSRRTISQALAIYLYWLKTGSDKESIANHFGIITRRQVSAFCQQIRDALAKKFVPNNIGSDHLTRNEFLKHNTKISSRLFDLEGQKLAVLADGTYCNMQKSSNFYFQRVTYSGQKKRHLVKPFVICCTDGYIIDIFGLYHELQTTQV